MKWVSIKDKMPQDYDWVIVGHVEPDDGNTVYGIARWYPKTGWDFMHTNKDYIDSPSCGDAYGVIYLSKITHWFQVDELGDV